jgi:hypothetical protein
MGGRVGVTVVEQNIVDWTAKDSCDVFPNTPPLIDVYPDEIKGNDRGPVTSCGVLDNERGGVQG